MICCDLLWTNLTYLGSALLCKYDVNRRNGEFVLRLPSDKYTAHVRIVTNWLDEIKARLAITTKR